MDASGTCPLNVPAVLDCTRIPPAEQEEGIRRLAAENDALEICGWRAAERNLDFLAVWTVRLVLRGLCGVYFAKGDRSAYFAQGGIEGVVARALGMPQSAWRVVARTNSLGGARVRLRVEKISNSAKKKLDSHADLT